MQIKQGQVPIEPFVLPAAPVPAPAMTPAVSLAPALAPAPGMSTTPLRHVPGVRPSTPAPAAALQLEGAATGPAAAREPGLAPGPAQRQPSSSAAPAALAQETQESPQTAFVAQSAGHFWQPAATAVAAEMAPELAPTMSHQPAVRTQNTPLQHTSRPATGPESSMSFTKATMPLRSSAEAPASHPACPPCTCSLAQAPAPEPSIAAQPGPATVPIARGTTLSKTLSMARAPQPLAGALLPGRRPCLLS